MIDKLSRFVEPEVSRIARSLHGLGLRPNHVTLASFFCSLAAALSFVFVTDYPAKWLSAGVLLLLSGLFDATDGLMARLYGEESNFGALSDSVLDRVSEIAVYWALIYSRLVDWQVGFAALSASLMVSYLRARGEGLGSCMKGVGIAERPERLFVLVVATFLGQLNAGAFLIAVLSSITILQRIKHARSTLAQHQQRDKESAANS